MLPSSPRRRLITESIKHYFEYVKGYNYIQGVVDDYSYTIEYFEEILELDFEFGELTWILKWIGKDDLASLLGEKPSYQEIVNTLNKIQFYPREDPNRIIIRTLKKMGFKVIDSP